ncbi:MAG: ATP-binding protein [Kiritimatiellaceae bacterium]|nr:ATP-binding protein [Kiritimatiellaceae bacterium]
MKYLNRTLQDALKNRLKQFPAVAVLGPRQCGKSTLARHVIENLDAVYLDLEIPSHLNKLNDAESFLRANKDRLVCLDEVQRAPELFPILRGLCDEKRTPGRFLILGSASPELLRQSSESMAGRIAYLDLTPFLISELKSGDLSRHWLRGGFPDSFLATSDEASLIWRQNFIRTYLERDLRLYETSLSETTMRRLWTMLAHANGQTLNAAKLAESIGVSAPTIRRYIDFLEHTYMLRQLHPWFVNVKKRLVKSPKLLFRDTGLLHALLNIQDRNSLFGHPVYGCSWESYVAAQLAGAADGQWNFYYYRTAKGDELDLVLQRGDRLMAVECKASASPQPSAGFYRSLDDLGLEQGYIVAPLDDEQEYPLNERATVISPTLLAARLA